MSILSRVTYDSDYDMEYSAAGSGILREQDLIPCQRIDVLMEDFRKEKKRDPTEFSLTLDPDFTGIDPAFLEKLENLKELGLPDSVTHLEVTPTILDILKRNNTLIRGSFDSFAERFAAEHGLRFRPTDIVFWEGSDKVREEGYRLTLRFRRDGSVYVKSEWFASTCHPGFTMGGEEKIPLNIALLKSQSAEQIAEWCGRHSQEVIKDGTLAQFLEKVKTHNFYEGKN